MAMGNLLERIGEYVRYIAWMLLCFGAIILMFMFIGWMQGCHMHLMEKHYHYAGEQPAVEITNDEGITLEIDE